MQAVWHNAVFMRVLVAERAAGPESEGRARVKVLLRARVKERAPYSTRVPVWCCMSASLETGRCLLAIPYERTHTTCAARPWLSAYDAVIHFRIQHKRPRPVGVVRVDSLTTILGK